MDYVVVLTVPDEVLDGVEDIEHAVGITNGALEWTVGKNTITVRPLSEVMPC